MIWFVATVHVIAALTLIFLVLLHSGKGGGLSDMFGGGLGVTGRNKQVQLVQSQSFSGGIAKAHPMKANPLLQG